MTGEEAIDLLDNLIGMVDDNHESDYDTALNMAIKALEQEPCEDCINRETARRIVDSGRTRKQMIDMILATPPVTPQPKTGHWVDRNGIRYCEFCGASNSTAYANYCPNCGVKMESEEE